MAKLKSKKAKLSFGDSITNILQAHGIDLDDSVRLPLIEDLTTFYNDTFRPDDKTVYFSQLVGQYMSIFEEVTEGDKAEFNFIHGKNLKLLTKVLMKRYLEKNHTGIWDLQTCMNQHELYYRAILTIPFMVKNFTPTMMYSRHTENISYLADQRRRQKEIDEKILAS